MRAPGGYITAIPSVQANKAIKDSRGALRRLRNRGSASASTLDRRTNINSTMDSGVVLPRRMYHKCCAKQIPILPASVALNTVVSRRESAEA